MYAVYWISENGEVRGNGEHILDMESLMAWLFRLMTKYPDMEHWGQDEKGNRLDI